MNDKPAPPQVVPLKWGDIEELPTLFANHAIVSHATGDEFYIIFGESGPPGEVLRGERPSQVTIRPVAKIALSPGSMLRIAKAIHTNAQNWQKKLQQEGEGDEDAN